MHEKVHILVYPRVQLICSQFAGEAARDNMRRRPLSVTVQDESATVIPRTLKANARQIPGVDFDGRLNVDIEIVDLLLHLLSDGRFSED